ncbi:MAG: hypothetical protein VX278_14755 [Myxococcota bacterium]|nr:hypothetical protein [Myxococcota bacterium]
MILAAILCIHLLVIFMLMTIRFWIHRMDKKMVRGSDLHMAKWAIKTKRRAYSSFHMRFARSDNFPQTLQEMQKNLLAELEKPQSNLKRDVDLNILQYVWRTDLSMEELVEFYDLNDNTIFAIEDRKQRPLIFRINMQRQTICVLFDHTVWDGIRIVNETIVPMIDCKPFDSRWLIKPRYTPVLSEMLQLYTSYVMLVRWFTHKPMQTFSEESKQRVYVHRMQVIDVKNIKNKLGCKFSSALLALWARQLFAWSHSDRTSIRFGLIVGFQVGRFRNNYSILSIDVKRNWGTEETIRQVEKQMSRRALEIFPLYELINNIEVQTLFKRSMVDVLFSPAFFEREEGPSRSISDLSMINLTSTCPV